MFWASLTRAAVPLFLMCSGALFLSPEKELPLKKLYGKYLPRVIAAMLVWAMAYKYYHLADEKTLNAANLWHAFKQVLIFNQEFHLYYIHIIILIYICLPILRIITSKADKRELEYCLAVWFTFGILYPTVGNFWPFTLVMGFPLQWMLNMTWAAAGYLLLGYYLRYIANVSKIVSAVLTAGGFAVVFFGTWFTCLRFGYFYDGFLGGMTVGVAMMAAGIFGLCPDVGVTGKVEGGQMRVIAWISQASFCIYLSHVFFLYLYEKIGNAAGLFPAALSAPVVAAAIFLCSCLVYAVISRIPIINKWLI
jgi:surface polysaccharide O-acyltransferase-like enzyme